MKLQLEGEREKEEETEEEEQEEKGEKWVGDGKSRRKKRAREINDQKSLQRP